MRIIRFSQFSNLRRLLSLIIISCSAFVTQPNFALEGGQSANASDYPGLVILSYDGPDAGSRLKNCTGIVLEQRRILTTLACIRYFGGSGFAQIPANNIYVHPVINGEIGGNIFLPPVTPLLTPNSRVSSYAVHPQNTFLSGPYDLAILRLSSNINLPVARIYNGTNSFIGSTVTAVAWKEQRRQNFPLDENYYVLNKLSFSIVDGNANINGLCYDNFTYTGTVFCGGFRNSVNFLEFSQDEGSPIYQSIGGQNTIIGLLSDASHGLLFEGQYQYERYARISSMVDFIRQHAPNTQFWNESSSEPQPEPSANNSFFSVLQLLLLDEDE